MPCNGVTVLKPVPIKVPPEILATPEIAATLQTALANQGITARVVASNNSIFVYHTLGTITVTRNKVRASGSGAGLRLQELQAMVQKTMQTISGYIAQQKSIAALKRITSVQSATRADNGAMVVEFDF